MHKVIKVVTTGSVGDLGVIAQVLADAGWDIAAVGGGEGLVAGQNRDHDIGVMTFMIRNDKDHDDEILDLIRGVTFANGRTLESVESHPALVAELKDVPGSLAEAAGLLGAADIDIRGVLLVDLHGRAAHVGFGFIDVPTRDAAAAILEGNEFILVDHGDHDS